MYWNIYEILAYQRNFNLINGPRSIGKTYTTQKHFVKHAINKNSEFVYLVRTKNEIQEGIFERAFEKVINNEFPSNEIMFTKDECFLLDDDNRTLGYCLAISDYVKIKTKSFPFVKFLLFDEYMLDTDKKSARYVSGWNEPDLFLNIYHTIDREEDRVICFLLGNNTMFYNPYHIHPAFNIPNIGEGEIWYSENVLFQRAVADDELKEAKSHSKFLKMISNTNYGDYASNGTYKDNIIEFIKPLSKGCAYKFGIIYNDIKFGIYVNYKEGLIYVSDKYNQSPVNLAITTDDHRENTLLTKSENSWLAWLRDNFKRGNVRFTTPEVKARFMPGLAMLL